MVEPRTSAPPTPADVVDISSSSDHSDGGRLEVEVEVEVEVCSLPRRKKGLGPRTAWRDEVEVWTPRQKRRRDEECCILSEDLSAAAEKVLFDASRAAVNDDVAVVAERGKVACRDYPHSRSMCVKYPFNNTPHERHCDQCFCYVCDIAAPCLSWRGSAGHCHASDKDKKWKTLRVTRQRK